MTTEDRRQPKTLEGIKSLARQLKKAHRLRHTVALDVAARQAGYESFRYAQNQLKDPP